MALSYPNRYAPPPVSTRFFTSVFVRLLLLLLIVFGISQAARADTYLNTPGTAPNPNQGRILREPRLESEDSMSSPLLRNETNFLVYGTLSPFDLIIPMKYGVGAGWRMDENATIELDYLRSAIELPIIVSDLGRITDQRLALVYRQFVGGSNFNYSFGLTYFRFLAHLGPELLGGAASAPGVDLLDQRTLGIQGSLGHRWHFSKNAALGIDWVSVAQPVVTLSTKSEILDRTTNADARDTVESALRIFRYFPRFVFFKVQLAFAF